MEFPCWEAAAAFQGDMAGLLSETCSPSTCTCSPRSRPGPGGHLVFLQPKVPRSPGHTAALDKGARVEETVFLGPCSSEQRARMLAVGFPLILVRVEFGEGTWASVLSPDCTAHSTLSPDLCK